MSVIDTGYDHQGGEIYNLVYTVGRSKNYADETAHLDRVVRAQLGRGQLTAGDFACGTGLHDEQFSRLGYKVTGTDLSAVQLASARKRNPKTKYVLGDMRHVNLGVQFDVTLNLFSAIGHMLTTQDLEAAVANMARHTRRGGLVIVEAWLNPGQFKDGVVSTDVVRTEAVDIVRMTYSTLPIERLSHMEMHHLVGRPGQGVKHFVEELDAALYTVAEYMAAFTAAGLTVELDPQGLIGRGLYVGRKN